MLDVSFELDRGPRMPRCLHPPARDTVVGLPGHDLAATAQLYVPAGWIPSDGTYSWSMSASDGTSSSPRSAPASSGGQRCPVGAVGGHDRHAAAAQGVDKAEFGISVNMATAGALRHDHFHLHNRRIRAVAQARLVFRRQKAGTRVGNPVATAELTVTAAYALGNYIKVRPVNKAGTPGPVATCVDGNGLDGRSCTYNALPRPQPLMRSRSRTHQVALEHEKTITRGRMPTAAARNS